MQISKICRHLREVWKCYQFFVIFLFLISKTGIIYDWREKVVYYNRYHFSLSIFISMCVLFRNMGHDSSVAAARSSPTLRVWAPSQSEFASPASPRSGTSASANTENRRASTTTGCTAGHRRENAITAERWPKIHSYHIRLLIKRKGSTEKFLI